ncbi:iron ABC transporter permease [Brachybacterium ginsengisoli]|uniref:Iron ABC transporter permease n=1 Tax=Brachybacterium ginsengisoli TaxID=1331682 RepID=A0A291GUX9_9MICO|nr:iron ABC transporter permease [Brachybacterium ginsengisoli]ATG53904.1 iron ABC transporter permease [Brachybacterium ginsengisoli]
MRRSTPLVIAGGVLALALACLLSLMVGARTVSPGTVMEALRSHDGALADHAVIQSRLLRTAAGVAVGAALAVAGAAMQGMTRNPLADPGILGINAGATTAVVLGVYLLDASRVAQFMGLALLGAGLGTVAVYAVASLGRDGATPVKLALAGAALTAGLGSLINALVMVDDSSLDRLRFWQVGTLGARSLRDIAGVGGLMAVGAVVILLAAGVLNALALGDDAAVGLGVKVGRARMLLGAAIILLCGAAVALAGPIGFLGLVVPHAARLLVGGDYRRIVPVCLLGGPVLILVADTVGRVIAPPAEVQVGVMTALLGVPVFVVLLRTRRQVGL